MGDVGGYVGGPYGGAGPMGGAPPTLEGATALDPAEMKYSCTLDFRSQAGTWRGGGKMLGLLTLIIPGF